MSILDDLAEFAQPSQGNKKGSGLSDLANGLGALYFGNQSYNALGDAASSARGYADTVGRNMSSMPTLDQMYGPTSAYATQLRQTLARKDAAAGRNSQYGPREAQFQAQLADKGMAYEAQRAQQAQQYQQAINAANQAAAANTLNQQKVRAQQLSSLFGLADKYGYTDKLAGLFGMGGQDQGGGIDNTQTSRADLYSDQAYGYNPDTANSTLYSNAGYGDTNIAPQATDAGTGGWGNGDPYQWY